MKNVSITYNPYKLTTDITINGEKPKPNSSLNVGGRRLQEWVERFPEILQREWKDNTFKICFTGTKVDFEDLKTVFSESDLKVSFDFLQKADVDDVEIAIRNIYKEIQSKDVEELKDKRIVDAFERASNQQFEINVVATMSAGKSTLINALLGKKLMPSAQKAKTKTIVKIMDKAGKEDFSAKAYDKDWRLKKELENISLNDMNEINDDPSISFVEVQGKIPFVSSTGMKLVLVDTPGPNNARDERHRLMTYDMLADSEKSLVLFVMNSTQLGTNDEESFLSYVYETMKKTGKQGRDRFIFVVNKMDEYKPQEDEDGAGCIVKALNDVKQNLEGKGIKHPNIFPVAALPALQLRSKDKKPYELLTYKMRLDDYDCMRFENYYDFSHLPLMARKTIEKDLRVGDDEGKVLIHTGIMSVEKAINLYVNKYARTTKVNDLVQSFNGTLIELATVAKIKDAIRNDESKKDNLTKQIEQIQQNINAARNTKNISSRIDDIDLTSKVERLVDGKLTAISDLMINYTATLGRKVERTIAEDICKDLERRFKDLPEQINADVNAIIRGCYKENYNSIIDEYKRYLSELNVGVDASALGFAPINLVIGHIDNLSDIIDSNSKREDESYDQPIPSEFRWYKPWTWGKDRKPTIHIEKYGDYVNIEAVADEYFAPIRGDMSEIRKKVIEHAEAETKKLKKCIKEKLVEIDGIIDAKLKDLTKTECESDTTDVEIKQNQQKLEWLEGLLKRVSDLVEF